MEDHNVLCTTPLLTSADVQRGKPTTEAAWPIRVGGRYLSSFHSKDTYFRVTSITGDRVHFVHTYADGREFAAMSFSVRLFCESAHPEDQSPIPELLAALKAVDSILKVYGDGMFAGPCAKQIRAAISKAEGH